MTKLIMNFKVGSYVTCGDITGYIRFVSPAYISICVNHDNKYNDMDCCVCCYPYNWGNIIVHDDVDKGYPSSRILPPP